tara:strand:+ start:1423 stop:2199 length:777 start_codon:yes stop_codon:yes gene_type:complete
VVGLAQPRPALLARPASLRWRCVVADAAVETPPAPAEAAATTPRTKVGTLLSSGEGAIGESIVLKGWVRTVRKQKTFSFIELNDGSSMKSVQVVAPGELDTYSVVESLTTGAAIAVHGEVVASPAKEQAFEVKATSLELVGSCPSDGYPLQKKRHTLEFLRGIAHLRARTNTLAAAARVRSTLAQATHEFFAGEGFRYVQTPILTASDCEGAGEMFRVTTLPADEKVARTEEGEVDFSEDFFGKPAFLTVSGQLSAET